MEHPPKQHVAVKICVEGDSNAAVWPMLSMAHQHPPRLTTKLPRYLKVLPNVDFRTYSRIEFGHAPFARHMHDGTLFMKQES